MERSFQNLKSTSTDKTSHRDDWLVGIAVNISSWLRSVGTFRAFAIILSEPGYFLSTLSRVLIVLLMFVRKSWQEFVGRVLFVTIFLHLEKMSILFFQLISVIADESFLQLQCREFCVSIPFAGIDIKYHHLPFDSLRNNRIVLFL